MKRIIDRDPTPTQTENFNFTQRLCCGCRNTFTDFVWRNEETGSQFPACGHQCAARVAGTERVAMIQFRPTVLRSSDSAAPTGGHARLKKGNRVD